jgi:hypothetical protein
MTIRDVQFDFGYTTASPSVSIVGAAGTYLAPNSLDTAPLGAYLTELNANDTQLSANVNTFRDLGGGERLWLVIDWVTAPTGGTSADVQLITSASSSLSSPTIMYDFGVVTIANLTGPTQYGKYVRQIAALPRSVAWLEYLGVQAVTVGTMTAGAFIAWIGKDVDADVLGYASGYGIK